MRNYCVITRGQTIQLRAHWTCSHCSWRSGSKWQVLRRHRWASAQGEERNWHNLPYFHKTHTWPFSFMFPSNCPAHRPSSCILETHSPLLIFPKFQSKEASNLSPNAQWKNTWNLSLHLHTRAIPGSRCPFSDGWNCLFTAASVTLSLVRALPTVGLQGCVHSLDKH